MTNIDAIEAKIGLNYPIEDATFAAAIAESGINPADEFTGGKSFDLALIAIIDTLIGSTERITESGYTVQLNLDALYRLRSLLVRKWGLPDLSGAYLIDKSYLH